MMDMALAVLVLGVVALALALDVVAVIGFLRRRIREHAKRSGP
jgi:hypothetical protein